MYPLTSGPDGMYPLTSRYRQVMYPSTSPLR